MKKLLFSLAFLPLFSFAQNKVDTSIKKKVKFTYVELDLTADQYDTINYVLSKTIAEFPTAVAAIKMMRNQAHVDTVFEIISVEPEKKKKK